MKKCSVHESSAKPLGLARNNPTSTVRGKFALAVLVSLLVGLFTAGCGSGGSDNAQVPLPPIEGPISVSEEIPDQEILSEGPRGESAVPARKVELSEDEIRELREGNYTAAIVMHYIGNDWSQAQVDGLRATLKKLGVEVLTVTDAQLQPEAQVGDIEAASAQTPDVIISIPTDPVSTAGAYQQAADNGIKLVFMDNVPTGLEAGEDYASVISSDNYGNGVEAAHIMGRKLDGEGRVGVLYHDADFFVTQQRTRGFEETIKDEYPGIEIVERGGFVQPSDADRVASSMLQRNPDLDGMFAAWAIPAENALAAVRSAGRAQGSDQLVMTTVDLEYTAALNMVQDGPIEGLGAQLPYAQGVAESIVAGKALLEKETPPYIAVPAVGVTRDNVLEAWRLAYREDPPERLRDAVENQ